MRPVHEYNVRVGGDIPQVPVLSKLAMSDQRHSGITSWHSSQVEGLVPVMGVQVQVLSPALQPGQEVTANCGFLPCAFQQARFCRSESCECKVLGVWNRWKREKKRAALVCFGLHPNPAVVILDDFLAVR